MKLDMLKRLAHFTFSINPETKQMEYVERVPKVKEHANDTHAFGMHEVPVFYELFLPEDVNYIHVTWDVKDFPLVPTTVKPDLKLSSVGRALDCIQNGLTKDTIGMDLPEFVNKYGEWPYFADGGVRDHIKALFTQRPITEADMHLKSEVDINDPETLGRRMKYFSTITAPPMVVDGIPIAHRGKVLEMTETEMPYGHVRDARIQLTSMSGKTWISEHRFIDIPKTHPWHILYDGMNFAGERGFDLGYGMANAPIGKIVRPRAISPWDTLKGLQMKADTGKFDFVWINGKKQLHFDNDNFYMFLMADVGGSESPMYDMQSLYNFYNIGDGPEIFAQDQEKFFTEMLELVENHELWFERFMKIAQDTKDPDAWLPVALAKRGIYNVFPAAFRSQAGMVAEPVAKARIGRIPMTDAYRRYITCPPDSIQDGQLTGTSRLKGNCVAAYNVPEGPIVFTPQPNGNPDAHYISTVVRSPWKCEDGWYMSPDMIMGTDTIASHHEKLEGRDNDDPEIGRTNPRVVKHFQDSIEGLFPKPVRQAPVTIIEHRPRASRYIDKIRGQFKGWSARALQQQIKVVIKQITIGLISNPVMVDNAITIGKPAMLDNIRKYIDETSAQIRQAQQNKTEYRDLEDFRERLEEAYINLEDLPNWRLFDISSNIEEWIDRVKMRGGVDNSVRERLEEFWNTSPVFPTSAKISRNQERGRIPESLIREGNVMFIDTPICAKLRLADDEIDALKEAFIEIESLLVRPLPKEMFAMFPANEEIVSLVSDMRKWTFDWWQDRRAEWPKGAKPDAAMLTAALKAYNEEQGDALLLSPVFCEHPEAVWVEWASRIYDMQRATADVNELGEGQHIHDAALWTTIMRTAGLSALDKSGLTGETHALDPNPGARVPSKAEVHVASGVVQLKKNGRVLGNALTCPDGDYTMIGKLILVKACHPALQCGWKR